MEVSVRDGAMNSLDKVTLIGNIDSPPKIGVMQNGDRVCKFPLVVPETWKNLRTEKSHQYTDLYHIIVFKESLIELLEQSCKSGDKLHIEGLRRTLNWKDFKSKKQMFKVEIVVGINDGEIKLLSNKKENENDGIR